MRQDPYPIHGKVRSWWRPWKIRCRCGLDAYPCQRLFEIAANEQREALAERNRLIIERTSIPSEVARARQLDAIAYAKDWRNEQRSAWEQRQRRNVR